MATMEENLVPRIGTFFLVIGMGFIILFVASDIAEDIYFSYFFIGLLLIAIGIFFRRKREAPPPSDRFSAIRKMREKANEKKKKS
ncbi:MAG: hypothetical protein B6I38_02020 [Anaerolineaceae bacterium 4572_5.1]|nr:MAG: hypothetical protein B6I38_02020 [Anaerolineaceae bacterium 4572_5.1]